MNLETTVVKKSLVNNKPMLEVDLYPDDQHKPRKKGTVDVHTDVENCLVEPGDTVTLRTQEKTIVPMPVVLGIICQVYSKCRFAPNYSGEPGKCGAYYDK